MTSNPLHQTTRRRAPIPEGGLKTNEQEARWLADTIELRTEEAFAKLGLSVSSKSVDDSLYKLLLLSLESATRRGRKAA